MSDEKPRGRWWRALMLGLYAVLAAVEFVVGKAKDWVADQVWGDSDEDDEEEEKK